MSSIEEVNYDISRIKSKMNDLSGYHSKHLLPQFGVDDKMDDEYNIKVLTEHITKSFQQAQLKVQKIGSSVKTNVKANVQTFQNQEEVVKKNVQAALATSLQELAIQFRKKPKRLFIKT